MMRIPARAALVAATLTLSAGLALGDTTDPLAEADARLAAGEWQAAADAYRTVAEVDPDNGAAWFGLGRAQHRLRRHDDAVAAFTKALDAGHSRPAVMLLTARAEAARGNDEAALEWLGQLADDGPSGRLQALNAPEFQLIKATAAFQDVLARLEPCTAAGYRQFDFWLGDWEVSSIAGGAARRAWNRISSIEDGCAVLEQYHTPGGYTGTSISYYDPASGRWTQAWMDNQGQPILHSGGLVEGSMVLANEPAEGQPLDRTTWTPLDDGRVRQHWQRSTDRGESWTTIFDGTYTRRRQDG